MLVVVLLFYKRLRSGLEGKSSNVNPYDQDVTTTILHGKQMIMYWCVDDLKVSHMEKSAVYVLVLKLVNLYGPNTTLVCGKILCVWEQEIHFASTFLVCFSN